ncbi:MAG TPA: NAD(P)H-quinone oxidoreductase [Gammaproteobacteria bacterium]
MRAVTMTGFGSAEVLTLSDVEKPVPDTGQVLIEVAATSVNRADIVQREGHYPPPKGDSEILGLEVAGTVTELGPGVEGVTVGDRVMTLVGGGGYAEFAVAYASHLIRIPHHLSFEQAACIAETYITAHLNIFVIGALADGEVALLHGGGGGVNTAGVQLCKALRPASRVFVTASPSKLERVRALGADVVIDYRSEAFDEMTREHTQGRGANFILDHIGSAYLSSNLNALSVGGRLVIIGVMGGAKAEINLARLMVKRHQIIGSVLRSRSVEEKARITRQFTDEVMPLFSSGTIVPLVHEVMPLEAVAEAHRAMESGAHFGKIVLSLM